MWLSIGSPAEQYMISHLEEGRSLSRALARIMRAASGEIFALLPDDADLNGTLRFDSAALLPHRERVSIGGRTVEPVNPPYAELSERVRAVLREVPETSCLAEHSFAGPGDPFLEGVSAHVVTLDQEVYFALAPENLSATMGRYLSWHSALAVGSMGKDLFTITTLSSGEIGVFAESSQLVAIRAYDGDGFLVWHRTDGRSVNVDS